MRRKLKDELIRISAAVALSALLAAGSSLGSPGFVRSDLPAAIAIMAGSAAWLGLVAYANRPQKKK